MLGLGVVTHEHPLAHGIRSQLLRVLYLAKLNCVYGHGFKGRLKWCGGESKRDVRYDDTEGHLFY
jgi:hypothetical protein